MDKICQVLKQPAIYKDNQLLMELRKFISNPNKSRNYEIEGFHRILLKYKPEYKIGIEQDIVQFFLDFLNLLQIIMNEKRTSEYEQFYYDENKTEEENSQKRHKIFLQSFEDCFTEFTSGQIKIVFTCQCDKIVKYESFYSLNVK